MKYFLPDQNSLREIFGAYMDKGLRFELKPDPYFGCYALKVRFAEGSNASPVLPLPPEKMQSRRRRGSGWSSCGMSSWRSLRAGCWSSY